VAIIPSRLQSDEFRFVLLGYEGERLKRPFEDAWQETANYRYDNPKLLAHKGNYGVCGGFGDLHIIDSDDLSRWEELGVLKLIPLTYTIESRPGHRQFYVKCKEHFQSGGLFDPERTEINKEGKPEYIHVGDIKASAKDGGICGGQAVGPGCKHPSGSIYRVVEDRPIAEVSGELIKSVISRFKTSKKVNTNYQRLEEDVTKARQRKYAKDKNPFDFLQVADIMPPDGNVSQSGDELRGDHPIHGSTNGGNYVINVSKNLWHCKRCESGGGPALAIAVKHGLISCSDAQAGELRGDLFKQVLKIAKEKYGLKDNGDGGEILKDLSDKIKVDPRNIKDIEVIKALASLKTNDPIEFDLTIEAIKKAHKGLKVDTINKLIEEWIESHKPTETQAETPKDIKEKAMAIAARGDTFRYLLWQAQRNHLEDINYQKALIASIASAASSKSKGIQPGGSGDKGSGKSDACAATYHLVPMDRRLDGSLSPMSLFYLQKTGRLKPGMILFSDDVEYGPIIPIYKRSTARFQKNTTHFTVSGGNTREALELQIPPRIVWWLTAVESVANEQAFDRQYPISTDSSIGHKQRVSKEIAAKRARKELDLAEDEGILIARELIADIFDNGPFKVLIPQAEKAEWLKVSDFRGQEQFWDLVDALCILRWRQRRKDKDGWLIADDQDLIEAKDIHTGQKVAHFADLTEAEVKVVGVMTDGHPHSQKQLTEALGIAQSTLSERLKSIMAKSAIITEDYDLGKKFYSINPNMQLGTDFWNGLDLIDLKIDCIEAYRSQQITLSACYRYVIGVPIGIIISNSNRIPSSLSVNLKERKEGYTCGNCSEWNICSSLRPSAENTDNARNEQQEPLSDTDKSGDNDRYDTITQSGEGDKTDQSSVSKVLPLRPPQRSNEIDAQQKGGEERAKAKEAHDRQMVKKFTLKAIYRPTGEALEYASLGLNLFTGCSHRCGYCYNKDRFTGPYDQSRKAASLENIEHDLRVLKNDKIPIHLSFVGDPYDLDRQDNSIVREVLQLCRKYDHPFQVLTKGGTKAVQDFDLYGPNDRFGVTLTFINDEDSKKWEPDASLPADRIAALKVAHEHGIKTWISLEPVIDPAQTLELIEQTHEFVDEYGVGKLNHNAELEKAIDWSKFKAAAETLLKKYNKPYKIKRALADATMYSKKKVDPYEPVKVRFLKDYRTQVPRPGVSNAYDDRLYLAGEVAEIARWKAEDLLKRGIVELVA
jgi:DNA repair photolyase